MFFDGVKEYWSNRVYITLGCGGFLIQEYIPGIEKEFNNAEHLVVVHDLNYLPDVIQYYLDHPVERETIAKQGYEWVRNYTYDVRAQKLVEILRIS